MARRSQPDPFAAKVGARIRELRQAEGLTLEKLAFSCDFSKGQLSTIEAGRAVPTAATLAKLADGLEVLPLDLLCFPDADDRQRLVEVTRKLSPAQIRAVLKLVERS